MAYILTWCTQSLWKPLLQGLRGVSGGAVELGWGNLSFLLFCPMLLWSSVQFFSSLTAFDTDCRWAIVSPRPLPVAPLVWMPDEMLKVTMKLVLEVDIPDLTEAQLFWVAIEMNYTLCFGKVSIYEKVPPWFTWASWGVALSLLRRACSVVSCQATWLF